LLEEQMVVNGALISVRSGSSAPSTGPGLPLTQPKSGENLLTPGLRGRPAR